MPSAIAQPSISVVNPITEIPIPAASFTDGVRIIVDDSTNPAFTDPQSGVQTIYVTVTTGVESIRVQLEETGDDTGIFKNVSLFFARQNLKEVQHGSTIKITQQVISNDFGLDTNDFIDTLYVDIFSILNPVTFDTRSFIFGFPLTETGPNTAIFASNLLLSEGPTTGNSIEVAGGDVLAIYDGEQYSNVLILPNPNNGLKIIRAAFNCSDTQFTCDTFTVSYADAVDTSVDIVRGTAGGGSGGGIVINRLVLDLVLAGGTSVGDFAPPQLTIPKPNLSNLPLISNILNFIQNADPFTPIMPLDDSSIDYPILINENGYLLTQYANTIQTYQGKTGEPVSFKMNLSDATGVEHIGFYTNLRGDAREVQDSDTYFTYNEGKPLEIADPHGFFSNVNFIESEYNGKYLAEFNMTFAKPMDTSDVIIRAWDELRNSGDIKIFDAIKIEGDPIVNPDTNSLIVPESSSIIVPYYKLHYYDIPNADSEGNLIYYHSFGGLEEKQVHPESAPILYPDYIGRDERHDDGFQESIISEDVRAQKMAQTILVNPFSLSEDDFKNPKFYYPSNVGKLDRENKDLLKDMLSKENMKAYKISSKKYHTNLVHD